MRKSCEKFQPLDNDSKKHCFEFPIMFSKKHRKTSAYVTPCAKDLFINMLMTGNFNLNCRL